MGCCWVDSNNLVCFVRVCILHRNIDIGTFVNSFIEKEPVKIVGIKLWQVVPIFWVLFFHNTPRSFKSIIETLFLGDCRKVSIAGFQRRLSCPEIMQRDVFVYALVLCMIFASVFGADGARMARS